MLALREKGHGGIAAGTWISAHVCVLDEAHVRTRERGATDDVIALVVVEELKLFHAFRANFSERVQ